MAATQDRTRFSRINGYASNAFDARIVLMTIHRISPPVKENINAQLPANFAIVSAARCPSVYFSFSFSGLTEILLSAKRFKTSSSVISCRMSFSTSFNNFLFSFMMILQIFCFSYNQNLLTDHLSFSNEVRIANPMTTLARIRPS